MVQNQKLIDAHKAEYWLKYTDCADLRKITITNCLISSNPSNFKCPALFIFYFYSGFFQRKNKVSFLVGFIGFF